MAERVTGPVLNGGTVARAVVAAIRAENLDATVEDRGGYLRVLVAGPCRVTRGAIESELGRPFSLERELEPVMPAFRGKFVLLAEEARWE